MSKFLDRPYDERRAMNGTFGEMYLDGEIVRETTALKAEVSLEYADVKMCGTFAKTQKVNGMSCKGSVTMTKTNSRMTLKLSDFIKQGKTPSFTIVSKLADPDSWGAERIVFKNVQFSTITLADWAADTIGTITSPFTFTDWDLLDVITPQ
ncbi:MAG: hypothetical protein BEN18_10280 [Epulopiscium sp. Nuni2H_MBin001]|nr:MAG: hypothetical protein BEN18_10280 [Epulopiscium sp. Nuni2H_MBin001]